MKPGIPWSVKGIDQEAREAAKYAARRSGMTLGEWLTSLILDTAGGEDDLDRRYGGTRLGERPMLDAGTGEGAVKGPLDQLARQLTALAEAEGPPTGGAAQFAARADEEALLERVVQRIDAHRQGQMAWTAGMVQRLEPYHAAALPRRRAAESANEIMGLQALDSALRHVIHRIEMSETRTCEAIRGLEGRLPDLAAEVREAREQGSRCDADDHVQAELARIAKDIEALSQSRQETADRVLAEAVEAARSEVQEAENRLDGLMVEAQRASRCAEELAESVSRFRPEIEDLKQRLDEHVSDSASDREAVSAVERHVARLADRLTAMERRLEEVTALERSVAELSRSIEETRGSTRATVEAVHSEAWAGAPAHVPEVSADLKALEEGLTAVRARAALADERTKEALYAVQKALDHIIGKLCELEVEKSRRVQALPVPRARLLTCPHQEAEGPVLEDFIAAARRAARFEPSTTRDAGPTGAGRQGATANRLAQSEGGSARRWSLFRRIRAAGARGRTGQANQDTGRCNRLLLAAMMLVAALASFPATRLAESHRSSEPRQIPAATIKPVDIAPRTAPRVPHRQAEARGVDAAQTNSW